MGSGSDKSDLRPTGCLYNPLQWGQVPINRAPTYKSLLGASLSAPWWLLGRCCALWAEPDRCHHHLFGSSLAVGWWLLGRRCALWAEPDHCHHHLLGGSLSGGSSVGFFHRNEEMFVRQKKPMDRKCSFGSSC